MYREFGKLFEKRLKDSKVLVEPRLETKKSQMIEQTKCGKAGGGEILDGKVKYRT